MITLNREDFIMLHKQGKKHSGIIICKEDQHPQKQAQIIHEFILKNSFLNGRLIRLKKQNQKGASQIFVVQEY